jgi:RHS repeat-associated protein
MRQTNTIVSKRSFTASIEANTGQFINRQVLANQNGNVLTSQTTELSSVENNYTIEQAQRVLGERLYELSNHLGNVLTVISDRKVGVDTWSYTSQVSGGYSLAVGSPNTYLQTTQGTHVQIVSSDGYVDYYTAEIVSSSEYSAYGAELPGYSYSASAYRYGFNGKELDPQGESMGGGGSTYDYGFRIYNPAIAKFLSVDPLRKDYPWNSVYSYAEGDVIRCIDLDGCEKLAVSGACPPDQYF